VEFNDAPAKPPQFLKQGLFKAIRELDRGTRSLLKTGHDFLKQSILAFKMVVDRPLRNLGMTIEDSFGPQIIRRFNLYPTAVISGSTAPGNSSGQALQLMEQIAKEEFPDSIGFDWSGVSLQERRSKGEEVYLFGLAVLLVYLILAFLYESWILPMAVILVVPLGLLGTVAAVWITGMDNNIYVQIGIILIIALASKNAILIVEFARELHVSGQSIVDASVNAARARFRPILMTSIAFILGVLPLVFATGAAAASRRSLGTAVCGGMITSTVLAIFFTPVFYAVFQWLSNRFTTTRKVDTEENATDKNATDKNGGDKNGGESQTQASV
jgi:multidrug efflux pump subunit AcrB